MEHRTVSVNLKHFEKLLRNYENDVGLCLMDGFEEAGTNPGDNYLSYVVRTKVHGYRGNGHPYENSVITKRLPDHKNVDVIRNRDCFENEAYFYTKIFPRLGLELVAPKCLEATSEHLIMEDLYLKGYKMSERKDFLDFKHCQATLEALACLHARSLIFKLKNPEEFECLISGLKEAAFPQDDEPALGQTISSGLSHGIDNLESIANPDEKILSAIEFMRSEKSGAYETMRGLVRRHGDNKYDVLTHGDAWNNNIFFKHDEKGDVTSVKFVDFQIARHISPAIDFHYFVYSSARSSVIEESYHDLVQIYQKSLVREMAKLGAEDNIIRDLSLEWFSKELKKFSMYGLLTGLWLINALLAKSDEILDFNEISPEYLTSAINYPQPIREEKVNRTKCLVLHYCRIYRNLK